MNFPEVDIEGFLSSFLARTPLLAKEFHKQRPTHEVTSWTKAVKKVLAELGTERGYQSLYSDRESDLHEFLVDFVWWDKRAGGGGVLACECEFGNSRYEKGNPTLVADDFDKLLSFKAGVKLMIFDSYGEHAKVETTTKDVLKELNRFLGEYGQHLRNERYLLVDLAEKNRVWKCDVQKDGPDPTLHFEEVYGL